MSKATEILLAIGLLACILSVLLIPVSVQCAHCGEQAESKPLFVYHTFPLPDVMHHKCCHEADFTNLPHSPSYPRYRRPAP